MGQVRHRTALRQPEDPPHAVRLRPLQADAPEEEGSSAKSARESVCLLCESRVHAQRSEGVKGTLLVTIITGLYACYGRSEIPNRQQGGCQAAKSSREVCS